MPGRVAGIAACVLVLSATSCAHHSPAASATSAARSGVSPGNIDLTSISGQSDTFTATYLGDISLPVANINAGVTAVQAVDAFLAQYAFYLFVDNPGDQQQTLDLITDVASVRTQLASDRTKFTTRTAGSTMAMPVFWDAKQAPVSFSATRVATTTRVRLTAGTLYFTAYNPAAVPKNLTWQDSRARDAAMSMVITSLVLTFGPTVASSGGYAIAPVESYTIG